MGNDSGENSRNAGGASGENATSMAAFYMDGLTKFSGEDKTVSSSKWAQDIEDNAEIFGWTASQKLIFARRSLEGTAALWLKGEKPFKTYEELKTALQKEFSESTNIKEMHEIMAARKKKKDETYYQYMLVMKELGRRAKFPDYVSIQYIIDGIQDYEPNKSILYGSTTYSVLKEKLLLYEKMKTRTKTDKGGQKREKDDRKAPAQTQGQRQRCYNCGDTNHVASECPNGVKCFRCDKFGHISSNCPEKAENIEESK